MFDHVLIRRSVDGSVITAGQIAEALFYYQKVQLFLDTGTVQGLVKQLGIGQFLSLLARHDVSAVYCEEILGTHTEAIGVMQAHNFVAVSISGNVTAGDLKNPEDRLEYRLIADGIPKKDAKKFTKYFFDRVPIKKLSGNHFTKGGVTVAAQRDLLDAEFLKQAVPRAVAQMEGYDPGDNISFDVINTELGNFVSTNIDFDAINNRRLQGQPDLNGSLTVAHILSSVLDARADLALASHYGGDFITSSVTSSIIQVRHSELLRRSHLNAEAQRQFTEIHVPDALSIAEVVDSGEREFKEFLTLMDHGARFKDWLKSVNPDEGLVRTYIRDISKNASIQSLPVKGIRYFLATMLGTAGFTTGAVAGFADAFLIDKFFGGWRPNHFVKNKFVPFINRR
jgi:hypothetical protein